MTRKTFVSINPSISGAEADSSKFLLSHKRRREGRSHSSPGSEPSHQGLVVTLVDLLADRSSQHRSKDHHSLRKEREISPSPDQYTSLSKISSRMAFRKLPVSPGLSSLPSFCVCVYIYIPYLCIYWFCFTELYVRNHGNE